MTEEANLFNPCNLWFSARAKPKEMNGARLRLSFHHESIGLYEKRGAAYNSIQTLSHICKMGEKMCMISPGMKRPLGRSARKATPYKRFLIPD